MRAFRLSAWVTRSRAGGETGVCLFKRHLPFVTALCGLLRDGATQTREKRPNACPHVGERRRTGFRKET